MIKKLVLLAGVSMVFAGAAFSQGDSNKPVSTSSSDAKPAAASTTSEAKPARFTPNKDQIMQGQKFLKEGKMYTGEATGVYNEETRTAIRKYQKENGLTVSGNFNKATLEKMGIALTDKQKGIATVATAKTAASDSTPAKPSVAKTTSSSGPTSSTDAGPKRPAPFQANKDQIMSLQKTLKDAKLFAGEATGERSDELKEAVKKYQAASGLKATGGINADTLKKAGIELTDKQKQQVAAQAAYDAAKPTDQ